MDLGIAGRTALVLGSSQGLGRACAEALIAEGVNVTINGRDRHKLAQAAAEVQANAAYGATCSYVEADVLTDAGRAAVLSALPEADILVTNNRGPRPAAFDDVTTDDLEEGIRLHYLTPIFFVRHYLPGMRARRWGRIVNITSAMVAAPHALMLASAGARTGLTAVMKAIQRDAVRDNVTINQLLPERIDSPRQLQVARVEMERDGLTFEEARARQASGVAAKRLGRPEEFGAACAFLCSENAGYISGSSLRVDGGSNAGLL
ncbi:SDR family oxidoreductase [Nonomuraea sp. NPDC050783]|uniref:SDR family oxidoreductase n=1 Tax=Nonomuraea sp. NPDC050783 TaxID=3154634 RepID=UPI003465925B